MKKNREGGMGREQEDTRSRDLLVEETCGSQVE